MHKLLPFLLLLAPFFTVTAQVSLNPNSACRGTQLTITVSGINHTAATSGCGAITTSVAGLTSGSNTNVVLSPTSISSASSTMTMVFNIPSNFTPGVYGLNVHKNCPAVGSCSSCFTVLGAPAQPGTITGPTAPCSGTQQSYSVAAVSGATSYTWTLPGGWTGSSTTTGISATPNTTAGNVSVTANNTCGSSTPQTLAVTPTTVPAQPGSISGSSAPCIGSSPTYSVSAVSGATSYTWTLPGGWTGTSTTASITPTVTAASGTVSVTANNACGPSVARTLSVSPIGVPAQPGVISGANTPCAGTSQTYSVTAVNGATTYTWTLPGGWTGTSTSNSITVTPSSTAGTISVTANNTCGSSLQRTLSVTPNAVPAQPGTISGNPNLCAGSSQSYSVSAVSGATSYTWTLPNGWSGASSTASITATANANSGTVSVTANNTCGASTPRNLAVNPTEIPAQPGSITGNNTPCPSGTEVYSVAAVAGATGYTWTLPSGWGGTSTASSISTTPNNTAGTISVTADNVCGSSTAQTLAVTPGSSAPAQPGAISGSSAPCISGTETYSVAPVTGASTYNWTLPNGWSGTSTSNSISATVGATGGTISVVAVNGCGNSPAETLVVTTNDIPAQPGLIAGADTLCEGSSDTYSISAVSGATMYNWTLPNGWTGTSTTESISLTAAANSGDVQVTAENVCGASSASVLSVTALPLPATPGNVTGPTTLCDGDNATYTIAAVNNADDYTWQLPSGWNGTSTGLSISTTATATGGDVSVTANNGCGTSAAAVLSVTANALPPQPTITQSGNVLTSSAATGNQWYNGANPVNGEMGTTYTPGASGTYSVEVTVNGCSSASAPYNFTLVGIDNVATAGFSVYPNPVVHTLNIQTPAAGTFKAEVLTLGGQIMQTVEAEKQVQLNTNLWASGVYYVRVSNQNKVGFVKVVKE